MTVEHGPLGDGDYDQDFSWWLSGKMILYSAKLFRQLGLSVSYHTESNRLSLYGESKNAGSEMKAGFVSAFFPIMTIFIFFAIFVTTGATGNIVGQHFGFWPHTAFLFITVLLGIIAMLSIDGLCERMKNMTVVDHTTQPLPDDLDDLKQQFVDGGLGDEEFEAQLEDRLTEVDG